MYICKCIMDELCIQLNCISVSSKLISDIDSIITEINSYDSYDIDIYEICVSCGHALTWEIEYTLTPGDINWLNNCSKTYIFTRLNARKLIDTPEKYRYVNCIYDNLLKLFQLHFEN